MFIAKPSPITVFSLSIRTGATSVAQSDTYPTGDQEVTGSILTGSSNVISWRFKKYFLRSFSLFRRCKKGSDQFLAKECAQEMVNRLNRCHFTLTDQ